MLVFLKPDGYVRKYVGARALKEIMKLEPSVDYFGEFRPDKMFMSDKHYANLKGKPIFEWLIRYVTSTPIIAMIIGGEGIAQKVRTLLGATLCENADPSSIRGRYGIGRGINVAHASESAEVGEKEVNMWKSMLNILEGADYESKAREYIEKYENYPMIDSIRFREIGGDLNKGKIKADEAKETFKYFIAQETDLDIDSLDEFLSVSVDNFLR